jgi:hypothetical protein
MQGGCTGVRFAGGCGVQCRAGPAAPGGLPLVPGIRARRELGVPAVAAEPARSAQRGAS